MYRLGPQFRLLAMSVLLLFEIHSAFGWTQLTGNLTSGSEIKAPRREPMKVGGNSSEDHRRHVVYPIYPEQAKRERTEGNVNLTLTVNEEGCVYDVAGAPGNNAVLEESAIAAVRKWRFAPWLLMGGPIPVVVGVTIPFVWKDREDVHVWLDDSGLSCNIKQILEAKGEVWIEAHARYGLIEDLFRALKQNGVQRVRWLGYETFQNQLFRSMDMIEKDGFNFNVSDIDRVNRVALASGRFGEGSHQSLRYVLYFDGSHTFAGMRRLEGPEIPEVEAAIKQLRPKSISSVDQPVAISFYLPAKPALDTSR